MAILLNMKIIEQHKRTRDLVESDVFVVRRSSLWLKNSKLMSTKSSIPSRRYISMKWIIVIDLHLLQNGDWLK